MRYALCLHGMAFGTTNIGNKADWRGAFPYFEKNVLGPDVDVFLHTWRPRDPLDTEEQSIIRGDVSWIELLKTYNPPQGIMDPQKEFPGVAETMSIYSRWYSALESFKLASENGKYNGFLSCRYDLVFKSKFPWQSLDPKALWTPKWREKPAPDSGYLDYWFYSGVENMAKLVSLYYNIDAMFKEFGVKENGHSVVGCQIDSMKAGGTIVNQWGEQPEDFILFRRMMGATN